jgi:hypothetical protein
MTYILYAIIYFLAGRGVYLLSSAYERNAGLKEVRHFKILTILTWPVLILWMGTA